MSNFQIEICNWEKYNPRNDAKNWSWFRFQVGFFDDEDLDDLPGAHLLVFIYLCCKRAKNPDKIVEIKARHCAKKARTSVSGVAAALRSLADLGLIEIHQDADVEVLGRADAFAHVRERPNPFPTDVTDGRYDTNETERTNNSEGPSAKAPPPVQVMIPEVLEPDPPLKAKKAKRQAPPSSEVWESYRVAYSKRYGHDPVRNAKVNGQCAQLVARLGAEVAKHVVEFYLTHSDGFYVRTMHALGPCVQNAEALHTQMLKGHRMTAAESQQKDKQQGTMQAFANVFAKLEAEGVIKHES